MPTPPMSPTRTEDDEGLRDLALAEEGSEEEEGGEVTSAPSDEDQSETLKIVTEAVESATVPRPTMVDGQPTRKMRCPRRQRFHLPDPFSPEEVENQGTDMQTP